MIEKLFINFRNFLWNYPLYIFSFYKKFSPISYILTSIVIILLLLYYFFSIKFFSLNIFKSNTFRSGIVAENMSYNPYSENNKTLRNDINSIAFNTLVSITPKNTINGEIAQSWSSTNNNTTYIFNLRKKIYFQNGLNVNANDVVYSFNFKKSNFPSAILSNITIRKLGKYKVEFNLNKVDVTFFEDINFIIIPVGTNYLINTQHLVGTGPYSLDYLTNKEAVFTRFNNYYKGKPHFKKFIIKIYKNDMSLKKALETHKINGAFFDYYPYNLTNKNMFNVLTSYNVRDYVALFFNLKNVTNQNIRDAFALDTPRKELIKNELLSFATPIYSSISPYSWAYDSSSNIQRFHFNPLKAAKYLNAEEISMNIYTIDTIPNRVLEFLKNKWGNIGINVKFIKENQKSLDSIIRSGKYQSILTEIKGSVSDTNFSLWYSKSFNNISNLNVPQIDRLLIVGDTIPNIKSRKAVYDLFQSILPQYNPAVFIYSPKYIYIVDKNIKNIYFKNVTYSYYQFQNVYNWKLSY